jgi:glycosyltransferase 2 family protein
MGAERYRRTSRLASLVDCRAFNDRLESGENSDDGARPLRTLKRIFQVLKQNWFWLKWLVALSFLAYLFYAYRPQLANLLAQRPNWNYLALALLVVAASITLTFYRWYLLVWAQDFPFTVKDALRLSFIGYACNLIGPGSAGGDLIKATLIATEQTSRKGVAAATVLLDRILGVLALFMVGAISMFFQPPQLLAHPIVKTYLAVLWIGAVGGMIGVALLLHPAVPRSGLMRRLVQLPKVGGMIGGLVNAVLLYQSRRRVLVLCVIISIVGHFGMLSGFYFCSRAVQAGAAAPGYWGHLLLIPGAEVGAVFVPVPAGLGAFEGLVARSYEVANEAAGMPVPAAAAEGAGVATALAYRVVTMIIAAVGALYYFASRREINRALSSEPPPEPCPQP